MATDIRRMSKEDLDELNRQAKVWRASRDKPTPDQSAQPADTRFFMFSNYPRERGASLLAAFLLIPVEDFQLYSLLRPAVSTARLPNVLTRSTTLSVRNSRKFSRSTSRTPVGGPHFKEEFSNARA